MSEKWKIRVTGYGTFDFEGTEEQAEERRRHKANWEGGTGIKWRSENQTELDKLTAEMAALFDDGRGVPIELMQKIAVAKALAKQMVAAKATGA